MKKSLTRGIAVVVIATNVGLVIPVAAFAQSQHKGSRVTSTTLPGTTTTVKTTPLKTWRQQLAAYSSARQAINRTFQSAVESAQAAFQSAKTQATTAASRSTARAAFELALTQTAAARDSALTALGNPPLPPASR
jgi:hypothetical protein